MTTLRVIELADGDQWACNRDGEGVWHLSRSGFWGQCMGTGQAPGPRKQAFRTPRALSRFVREHFRTADGGTLPRMVDSWDW